MIDGLLVLPLRRYEDERGWFYELRRDSLLPSGTVQTNVSFSRQGVIRGLHYHERGQDDLFACLAGMARIVVLDRTSGETFCLDIGESNPAAVYVPGRSRARLRGADGLPLHATTSPSSTTLSDPDEHTVPWNDPRVRDLWSTRSPILSERDSRASS